MAADEARDINSARSKRRGRAQTTPEEREKYLQSLAFDLAERQLLEGKASSQVITQLMKGGGVREQLEMERLRNENRLLNARIDGMESAARMEASIEAALEAFRSYRPTLSDDPDD
jgi:hypothetical protein